MEDAFDVDCRDVIGEKHDLVCVYLVLIFVEQILWLDEAGLQKTRYECSCSGERIEDVDAAVADGRAEVLLQDALDGLDDEVDNRHRSIDDAELLNRVLEGDIEEVVVKLNDNRLLLRGSCLVARLVTD